MTDYSCPKCGLVESTWAAQENETGSGCPECMFIRIRELEAEFETQRQNRLFQMGVSEGWKARAEKAEAELANANENIVELRLSLEDHGIDCERAKARVAELEAEIRVCVRHGMPLTKDEVEALEREEC